MIKNRSFMFGLGFGLVVGALLLQLMISAGITEPTKEQIVKEATKLDLKVSDAAEKLLTEEEWVALQEQGSLSDNEIKDVGEKNVTTEPDVAVAPEVAAAPEDATAPEDAVAPSVPFSPEQSEVKKPSASAVPAATLPPVSSNPSNNDGISLRIPSGSTLSEVADLLSEAGVIEDKRLFLREATNLGAAKVIQYGKYDFKKKESYNSIIEKLMTVK